MAPLVFESPEGAAEAEAVRLAAVVALVARFADVAGPGRGGATDEAPPLGRTGELGMVARARRVFVPGWKRRNSENSVKDMDAPARRVKVKV